MFGSWPSHPSKATGHAGQDKTGQDRTDDALAQTMLIPNANKHAVAEGRLKTYAPYYRP